MKSVHNVQSYYNRRESAICYAVTYWVVLAIILTYVHAYQKKR